MDSGPDPTPNKTPATRHKCSACFKQYKKKEHLIEHMRVSYHSVHEPKCGVCKKHCKSFESVREHLMGPLPKANCAKIYSARGCDLCLNVLDSTEARDAHKELCRLSPASSAPPSINLKFVENGSPLDMEISGLPSASDSNEVPKVVALDCEMGPPTTNLKFVENGSPLDMEISGLPSPSDGNEVPKVVALDCEMVGGGSDGSLDLCGRVCIIDEEENVIFHSYVIPQIPVTNYRFEVTGITEENLKDAMPLKLVQEKVQEILFNGESIWKIRLDGGKARILVGHDLEHDLCCLRLNYPDHLIRDTAKYHPLMKTNLISHSLKYLTQTYLGYLLALDFTVQKTSRVSFRYDIQSGVHDPYEDSVAAMRLYKRMRAQVHEPAEALTLSGSLLDPWIQKQVEKMTPDALLEISRSNYKCWCLDLGQPIQS